jgi:hypothetical protein
MARLGDAYLYHRSLGYRAADALDLAHHDLLRGKVRYGRAGQAVAYDPEFAAYGESRLRWIENVTDGLRFVGYADELARLDQSGWYLDDYCGETVRGAVWQLPGRHGAPLYVAGYADPWNDNAACLSFDELTDDKAAAAQWADSIAERMAEAERDYQRAASAGFEFGELAEDIARRRREILDLLRERKAVAGPACKTLPAICGALRDRIAANVKAIRQARKRRAELLDAFGREPAFRDAA